MSKETYTKHELLDFGNYLLSKERRVIKLNATQFTPEMRVQNLQEVSDADFQNWRSKYQYAAGQMECAICGHEWTAVRPVATEKLECPNCSHMNENEL